MIPQKMPDLHNSLLFTTDIKQALKLDLCSNKCLSESLFLFPKWILKDGFN